MKDESPKITQEFYDLLLPWFDAPTVQAFVVGYRKLYWHIAAAFGFPFHEREDFVHDCFLIVVQAAPKYDKSRNFWRWAATIGWNEGKNRNRSLSRRSAREKEHVVEPPGKKTREAPDLLVDVESLDHVLRIIEAMRKKAQSQRKGMRAETINIGLLMLRDDLSTAEVATMFGKSEGYVGTARNRLLNAIQKRLGV